MAASGEKPAYMAYLELKGVRPGGCFCFDDEPQRLYRVTRNCRLLNLAGEPAALTENDFWERLDLLRAVSAEEFEAARDRIRAQKGQPTQAALEPIAADFAREYAQFYTQGRWKSAARYDEETMRRLLRRAIALINAQRPVPQKERRALFDRMFHDLVQEKTAVFRQRGKEDHSGQP